MVAEVIDYRVSRIVVLCKDCGEDVGPYPARHKCGLPYSDAPPLPTMSGWAKLKAAKDQGKLANSSDTQNTTGNSRTGSKQENQGDNGAEGLWGKLRTVRNWKDVSEGATPATQQTQGSKLWDKLLNATSSLKENIVNIGAESDNESDKEGWEGETHISRILREYYEKKSGELPDWLYNGKPKNRLDIRSSSSSPVGNHSQHSRSEKDETSYSKKSFKDIYQSAQAEGFSGSNLSSSTNNTATRKPRLWDTEPSSYSSPSKERYQGSDINQPGPSSYSSPSKERYQGSDINQSGPSSYSSPSKERYQGSDINQSGPSSYSSPSRERYRGSDNNQSGLQSGGGASSSSNITSPLQHLQKERYPSRPVERNSNSPASRNTRQKDPYMQYRTTGGQYYDDFPSVARSVSPNPMSRSYTASPVDNSGYDRYGSSYTDSAYSRGGSGSRGRANRQGGYFG